MGRSVRWRRRRRCAVRVGVIDCGTNTVRLFIADGQRGDGPLTDVVRVLRFVQLGQGVDATRLFRADALARTFGALDEFAHIIADHGPLDCLRFLATSAARDATNRDELFEGVQARLGVVPEIISGEEEARLSYLGALAGGPTAGGRTLVMDIGGGSTELIIGDASGVVEVAHSFDMGSVRLRERFLVDDPPTPSQVADARGFVAAMLDDGPVHFPGTGGGAPMGCFIGVAGTNTSLAAMNLGLTSYDSSLVHNSMLQPGQIHRLARHLLASSVADVTAEYAMLEPMRAGVIAAGSLICDEVTARVGCELLVRETDILDGAALDMVRALVAQR